MEYEYDYNTFEAYINYGNITGSYRAGGIAGEQSNGNTSFTDCINRGTITGTGTDVTGSTAAGGITGQKGDGGFITGCKNYGTVIGVSRVGGIAGSAGGNVPIMNYANRGNVTASNKTAYGISCGLMTYARKNTGTISGATVYAIVDNADINSDRFYITGNTGGSGAFKRFSRTETAATGWPAEDAVKDWGVYVGGDTPDPYDTGSSANKGKFWKSGTAGVYGVYPKLWWE